jgi:hypothetical protein
MKQQTANIVRAFLQGFTGAGLFRRLDYPGAPVEFVDSRSLDEIRASGEIDQIDHRSDSNAGSRNQGRS